MPDWYVTRLIRRRKGWSTTPPKHTVKTTPTPLENLFIRDLMSGFCILLLFWGARIGDLRVTESGKWTTFESFASPKHYPSQRERESG